MNEHNDLRAETERLRAIIRKAHQRLMDTDGRDSHDVYLIILAVRKILREGREIASAQTAPLRSDDLPPCVTSGWRNE